MDNLIYVVMIEDRHVDVEVELFVNKERAIERAKEIFNEEDRYSNGKEEKLSPTMVEDGWVYFAIYSCESDSIRVLERKLNKDL